MKRLLSLLLLSQLLLIPLAQADFSDTTEDTYLDTIEYLQEKGVIEGYDGGNFRPEQPVTRAEFLKMMLASYDIDPSTIETRSYPYQDVPEDSWFAPYVQKAYEINLTPNKSEFNPHETLSRVEGIQTILNLMGVPVPRLMHEKDWTLNYRDVRFDAWYAPTVFYGETYDLIEPLDTEYFRPLKKLTRGEATQLLYKMDVFLYGSQLVDDFAELESELFSEELTYEIPHLDIFVDVWNRLHTDYYDRDSINTDELIYGAMEGMIEALGDDYGTFMPPVESTSYSNFLEGQLIGIGAHLKESDEGYITVHSFVTGAPAELSGLHVNDRIMAIDGVDVSESNLGEVSGLIRGDVDTDVTLTISRDKLNTTLDVTITRAIIDVGYISGELMGDAIYVDINLFDSMSFIDFTQTITPLIEENPDFEGFVFDLRNNPGGYLESLTSVLGHFIPYGKPLVYLYYGGNQSAFHMSQGAGEWADYPIVILINEESASAAEIMALVLKEEVDAVIVGKTSYGKGTVQEIIRYVGGSSLKITIAEWRSPNFHSINGQGVSPHYDVDFSLEDFENGLDPQLDAALEALELEIADRAAEEARAALEAEEEADE
jgi:carboxyl-terminal processing protease